MDNDLDEEGDQLPVLSNAELARVLAAQRDCTQIHLLAHEKDRGDCDYLNVLREQYGSTFDQRCAFRVREPVDLRSLARIPSLRALSLCDFNLNSANWRFLAHHRNSLELLYLRGNNIEAGAETLAEQLCHISKLSVLTLVGNRISPEGFEVFAQQLHGLTNLRTLDLESSGIQPEIAENLGEQFQHLTLLTTLNLRCNELGPLGAKLVEHIHELTQLTTLKLGYNIMGPEGAEKLAGQLHHLTKLTMLDLAGNRIGPEGAGKLAQQLSHLTKLTALDLERNRIDPEGAEKLAQQLHHLPKVATLNLRGGHIGPEGAERLAEQLHHLNGLTTLDLGLNLIGAHGAEKLAKALRHLTNITTLNLGYNDIGLSGIEKLAAQLRHLSNLATLELRSNGIGTEGAEKIADALCHLGELRFLDLNHNRIGAGGLEKLAQQLYHVTKLTILDLGDNDIGPRGAEKVAAQFHHLSQLSALKLPSNRLGSEGTEKLAEHLHHLRELSTLELATNGIDDKGIQSLAAAYGRGAAKRLQTVGFIANNIHCVEKALLETRDAQSIFRAILEGTTLAHARVMLVGMGGVGKSSLFRRCFLKKLETARKRQPTHDIDMIHAGQCKWKPRLEGTGPSAGSRETSRTIEPTVWDFGGQLVLHGIHETFLGNDGRTIYVVVLDASQVPEYGPSDQDGQTGNRLTYWLKTIRHFAGDVAPIVIAITKRDKSPADWLVDQPIQVSESRSSLVVARLPENELGLFRRTHGVTVIKIVDPCSARDKSISIMPLRHAIEAALSKLGAVKDENQGLVNRELPPLKKVVERAVFRRTLVPLSEFRDWCRSSRLTVQDRMTQETFLRQLHHLGSLLYFGRTRNEVSLPETTIRRRPPGEVRWLLATRTGTLQESIFNPNWLKYAVYSVIRRADGMPWITEGELRKAVRSGTRKFVKSDPETRVVNAKQAGLEFAAVKEFLELSELAWYDAGKQKYLLPRGLKTPLPDSSDWPASELTWEFLPEANFHRFIVHLHNRNQVVPVENKKEWHHGRNWVLIADAPLRNEAKLEACAKALVVGFPAEGRVQIRFDPRGDASRWQAMHDFVQDVFENEIQKKPVINQPATPQPQSPEVLTRAKSASRTDREALQPQAKASSFEDLVKGLAPARRRDFLSYWYMVVAASPCGPEDKSHEVYRQMVALLEDCDGTEYRELRAIIIDVFREIAPEGEPHLVEVQPGKKLEIPQRGAWRRNLQHAVEQFSDDVQGKAVLEQCGLGGQHGKRQRRIKPWQQH